MQLPPPLPLLAQGHHGKRSGCLTVNQVSQNKVGSDELERYQRFPPAFAKASAVVKSTMVDKSARQASLRSDEGGLATCFRRQFGLAKTFQTRSSISRRCPVVCGRVEGATPFESQPFSRSVAQSLERPAWDRKAAGENPAVPTISDFDGTQFKGIAGTSLQNKPPALAESPGQTARGVAATCSAWNRGTAGANPAALTNLMRWLDKIFAGIA